jgi:hypothetical protein
MQSILQISRLFGFLSVVSKSRVFMASYLVWSMLSVVLCLPLDFLYDSCGFIAALSDFNEGLYILIEGFFSFTLNEWRDDLVVLYLF